MPVVSHSLNPYSRAIPVVVRSSPGWRPGSLRASGDRVLVVNPKESREKSRIYYLGVLSALAISATKRENEAKMTPR